MAASSGFSDSGEGVHAKLFIAFFTSHRSPLSERLEQATFRLNCTRCLFLLGEVIPNKITTEITNAKSLLLSFSNVLDCFNVIVSHRDGPIKLYIHQTFLKSERIESHQ